MARTLTVTARKNISAPFMERAYVGETLQYGINFAPWAEDNGDITLTSATWTVKSGTATISAEAFSGNTGQANISFPQEGNALIEIDATDGTLVKTIFLDVRIIDPDTRSDY